MTDQIEAKDVIQAVDDYATGCPEGKEKFLKELDIERPSAYSDDDAFYIVVKVTPPVSDKDYRWHPGSIGLFGDAFIGGLVSGKHGPNSHDRSQGCRYEFGRAADGADFDDIAFYAPRFGRNARGEI